MSVLPLSVRLLTLQLNVHASNKCTVILFLYCSLRFSSRIRLKNTFPSFSLRNLVFSLNHRNNQGNYPLSVAVFDSHYGIVKVLLESGASPDEHDIQGCCPLSVAVFNGHYDIVKMLLEFGASPNHRDKQGDYPLSFAVFNGH